MSPDIDRVSACIRETAEIDIMPRFRALESHEVSEKKPGDVVTIADRDAEARLSRMLSGLYPDAIIIGEEATHDDPTLLQSLNGGSPLWIIDPVDGTSNFVAGKPEFAVMVAYIDHGQTVAGWIFDPVSGVMATAESGSGAVMNGSRVILDNVNAGGSIRGRINTGSFPEGVRPGLRHRFQQQYAIEKSLRCAGHEFLSLLRGDSQFRLYNRLWAWDHAPGVLLLAEAGGHVGRVDDMPYSPTERTRALLCAASQYLWRDLSDFMRTD